VTGASAAAGRGRESSPARRASIQNKSPEAARRLAALLVEPAPKGSGRSAVVTESWAADSLLTRVRVGPFADRWEAAAKLREMETLGYKPFIAAERE
jgi:SPOR domain